jgi:hypothetical protein
MSMPNETRSGRKAARRRARNARAIALLGLLVALAGLALAGAAASTDGTDPVGTATQSAAEAGDQAGTVPGDVTTTTTAPDPSADTPPSASALTAEPDVVAQDTPPSGLGSIQVTKETVPTFGAGSFTFTLAWSGATCNGGVPGSTQVTLTTPPSGATHTFTNLQTTGCTWTLTETVPAGWVVGVNCSGGASNTDTNPSTIVLGNGPPPAQLSADCTFTNTASPSITVTKQTDNDFPGTFTFTLSGGQGAGTSPPLSDGQSYTFTGLAFGTAYTIVENVPAGWTLAAGDIVCAGGSTSTATTNGRIITLTNSGAPANRNAQCTFTNRTRSIRVTKQTNPDGSPQTFALQLRDSGGNPIGAPQTVGDGQTATWVALAQGTFQVTEAVPTGWDLATAPCTGASANSAITNGRSITLGDTTNNDAVCTFTNTQRGQIVVTKDTDPEGNSGTFPVTLAGPNAFSESANLVDDGGQHTYLAPPGTPYNLTEDLTGLPYTLDNIACSRGAVPLNPASFQVLVADSITCTVTNDANPGTVTVTKDTNPEGGTGPFVVTLAGPNAYLQTKSLAADGSSDSFTAVPADNPYNLTESLTGLPYALESITCMNGQTVLDPASFRVLPGAAIQCTVTNDANPGQVIVTKDTNPEGGTGSFPITLTGPSAYSSNGTLTNDGGQHTFDPVPVGSGYALSENLTGLQYNLTSIVCNGTDVTQTTFAVGPGETVNCTITNAAKTGSVSVTKRTDPSGGTGTFPVTLSGPSSFSDSGNLVDDGGQHTFSNVPVASGYSLSEDTSGLGYTLGSIVCGGVDVTSGNFAVAADQTVECTVTNVRDPNPPPPAPEPGGSGAGEGSTAGPGPAQLVTGRPTGALAFTGSGILVPLTIAALALLVVGAGLLILRNRLRRPSPET